MTLFLIPQLDPFEIGVYDTEGNLVEKFVGDKKLSEGLNGVLYDFISRYPIETMIYVNGPGSHMATKIAYVTLKTAATVLDIPLYGCSAFDINGGKPLKAIGKLYFVKEKETIITKKLPEPVDTRFTLPKRIDVEALCKTALPDYRLSAV
jgi:hypothetical protein